MIQSIADLMERTFIEIEARKIAHRRAVAAWIGRSAIDLLVSGDSLEIIEARFMEQEIARAKKRRATRGLAKLSVKARQLSRAERNNEIVVRAKMYKGRRGLAEFLVRKFDLEGWRINDGKSLTARQMRTIIKNMEVSDTAFR